MERLADVESRIQSGLQSKDYESVYDDVTKIVCHFVRTRKILVNNRYDSDFVSQLIDDYCMCLIKHYESGQPIQHIYRYLMVYYALPLNSYLKNEVPGYSMLTEEELLDMVVALYSDSVNNQSLNEFVFADVVKSLPSLIKKDLTRVGPIKDKVAVMNTYLSILISLLQNKNHPVRLGTNAKQYFPLMLVSAVEIIKDELRSTIGDISWLSAEDILSQVLGDQLLANEVE